MRKLTQPTLLLMTILASGFLLAGNMNDATADIPPIDISPREPIPSPHWSLAYCEQYAYQEIAECIDDCKFWEELYDWQQNSPVSTGSSAALPIDSDSQCEQECRSSEYHLYECCRDQNDPNYTTDLTCRAFYEGIPSNGA